MSFFFRTVNGQMDVKALGTVKIIIRYKKANTERTIVNKSDCPKYSEMYPPGSIL